MEVYEVFRAYVGMCSTTNGNSGHVLHDGNTCPHNHKISTSAAATDGSVSHHKLIHTTLRSHECKSNGTPK